MRVTVTPRHRRAFRRGGIEFPAAGLVLDLAALSASARALIEAETWLVITPAPAEAGTVAPTPAPVEPAPVQTQAPRRRGRS